MKRLFVGLVTVFALFFTPSVGKYFSKGYSATKTVLGKNVDSKYLPKFLTVSKLSPLLNPNRPYNRNEVNRLFKIRRQEFHLEGLKRGKDGKSYFTDIYTGKKLIGGEFFQYDHIISSHAIFEKYKHILTDRQLSELINLKENIGPTMRPINQSKGKKDVLEWFRNLTEDNKFGVKQELVKEQQKIANLAVEKKAQELMLENKL